MVRMFNPNLIQYIDLDSNDGHTISMIGDDWFYADTKSVIKLCKLLNLQPISLEKGSYTMKENLQLEDILSELEECEE